MAVDQGADFFDGEECVIGAGIVAEPLRDKFSAQLLEVFIHEWLVGAGENGEIIPQIDSHGSVGVGDHLFVNLFTGSDPDLGVFAFRSDGLGDVKNPVGRDLGHEDLSSLSVLNCAQNEFHPIIQCDIESSHIRMSDRQNPGLTFLQKEGDDRAPGAHDITVADHAEADVAAAGILVGGDEELVGTELGSAIEIHWGAGFVGGEGDHVFYPSIDGGLDNVLGTNYVGLDKLHRIVFCGRNLLEGCGVNYDVDVLEGASKTVTVPNIAKKVAKAGEVTRRKFLSHLELLEFVPGKDDKPFDVRVLLQDSRHEAFSKGTGSAGNEYLFSVEHRLVVVSR